MPKRLANCRGFGNARFGRIRFGWRHYRMLTQLDELTVIKDKGDLDDKAMQKYESFKSRVKQIIPKALLRRHQAR